MKVYNRNAGGKKHKTEEFVSRIYLPQSSLRAGHQWLKPEILSTQEVEIKRILVQSQPRQVVCKTLSRGEVGETKAFTKKDWWNGSRCRP
jgi:hypothetical protein